MNRTLSFAVVGLLLGCPSEEPSTEADADTDTDTDTDSDTDTDTDAQLRLFFAAHHDADMGGVDGADALCQGDVDNPDAGATWKALLGSADRVPCAEPDCGSGTAGQVDWVLHPDRDYGLADGTFLFRTDGNGITNDTLPVDLDADAYNYWTGLKEDWTVFPETCSGWTSGASTAQGRLGWTHTRDDAGWLDGGLYTCNTAVSFLCVEQ